MSVYLDKAYECATEYMQGVHVEKSWQDIYTKMKQYVDTSHYLSLPFETRLSYRDVWNDIHNEFFHALQTEAIYQDTHHFACVTADDFLWDGTLAFTSEVFITFDNLEGQEHLSFHQLVSQNNGGVCSLLNETGEWILDQQDLIKLADKHFQALDPSIPLSNIQPTALNPAYTYQGVQFGAMQYSELKFAETCNLNQSQRTVLTNPSLDFSQIHVLADGFNKWFSVDQVQSMIQNELDGRQMRAIGTAVSLGCTTEEISTLIASNDRPCVISAKAQGMVHNYEPAELDAFFELSLSDSQIAALHQGFLHEVSLEDLALVSTASVDLPQAEAIVSALAYGFSKQDVAEMDIENMNLDQTVQILQSIANQTPREMISVYAKPSFTASQMLAIQDVIDEGFSLSEVQTMAKPSLSPDEMREELSDIEFGGI